MSCGLYLLVIFLLFVFWYLWVVLFGIMYGNDLLVEKMGSVWIRIDKVLGKLYLYIFCYFSNVIISIIISK